MELLCFMFVTDLSFSLECFGNAALASVVRSSLAVLSSIPLPILRVVYSKTGKNSPQELI